VPNILQIVMPFSSSYKLVSAVVPCFSHKKKKITVLHAKLCGVCHNLFMRSLIDEADGVDV
jgi:transcription elongation factor Elf1